jgi:hypothetical protein
LTNINANTKLRTTTTMADQPDLCAAHAITPMTTAATLQLDAVSVGTEDANSTNMDIVATQTNAAPDSDTNAAEVEHNLAVADKDPATSVSVNKITLALESDVATHQPSTATFTSQQSDAASEENAAVSADSNPSLFAKLPGELRNRIYRAFFEDFREQKKKTLDVKKTAPTYLKLLHTDRMIRSEASSIFYKEHFCVDNFIALMPDLESAMESRIESICELVAFRDIHMPISIIVQEMVPLQTKKLRQMPYAWDDSFGSNFLHKLSRFIATRTREAFVYTTGPKQLWNAMHPLADHIVYVGSKVHVGPRYRIERVDPDATLSHEQRRAQHQQYEEQLAQQGRLRHERLVRHWQQYDSSQSPAGQVQRRLAEYAAQRAHRMGLPQAPRGQGLLQGEQGQVAKAATQVSQRPRRQTGQERLDQQLETHESAEFLRVEGPLAELDWIMFE